MCLGLKDQIEYDAKGMMCLGELNIQELDLMLKGMIDTVEDLWRRRPPMRLQGLTWIRLP